MRIPLSFKLSALAIILSTASALATPTEISDALGRKVTVDLPVNRVALNFNFEEFTAVAGVDGWKKVVGISRAPWEGWRPLIFDRYKAAIPNLAAMPDIGHTDDSSFSAEKVIGLKPDVLFMSEWGYNAAKTQMAQIEGAGIPIVVIDYNAQKLDRHLASVRAVGKVLGNEERAEELATLYDAQYKDILARVDRAKAAGAPVKKVYVELARDGADTIGNTYNNTMWGAIITALGAENIATGKIPGPWGPLNAEAVIAEDPDMIIMASSSWVGKTKAVRTGYDIQPEETRASLTTYTQRPGWGNLKAVKAGELNAIEHGLARTLYDFTAIQFIAKRLYPEQFADVDPVLNFKNYHEHYLPVPYSGTWMLTLKP
ncbi:ABC transporter substrate-binding protein [Chelatococcus asaccharovorans]|uniref:ABC transporter substrate-binding protein n=1 Tax=Chelatococcus asaccharovorans TaxID=28210 RepID=UPI00224C74CD|nr:ABC transporter substrate-binding protein [Chelatococcus asaccharovorans]CAH1655530.1 ABC-type Fe3+-hydroxamate transport system substrate-binding protein [Chelatococcus asaccharovorans]CAH1685395.1 ABC-type Fe3+-hydroxamate transport system substrate-binding protein [Chelatococcus asaccharovorans]